VNFLGQVDHQDLPAAYDGADICVNASLADNFPGALIEASAAGLVVVSTNVGGIPFIYEDGKSALLVEPGDWKRLAAAISRLLQDPSLAVELARHAAEAVQACEWSKVRDRLYAVYEMPSGKARETVCVAG
jgi:glycosyltransferase involved in cell wall biosynthesis